jgi:hypothetical protein
MHTAEMGLLLHQHFERGSCLVHLAGIIRRAIGGSSLVVDSVFISLRDVTHFGILGFLCLLQFVDIVPGLVGVVMLLQFLSREKSSGLGKSETLV